MGRIFNPIDHKLHNNCVEFAQSPQTLVFDDFVRVFFSTRERDQTGKFLSHISYVDFDKTFQKIINISTDTVIPLGKLGCFDEHGIFPLNIFKDKDRVLGFISGWSRRVSVSVDTAIGLAISNDNGLTFARIGDGPVLSSSLNEPFLVGDPFVCIYGGVYHMWYIYGVNWFRGVGGNSPERVYKIGHATSVDCISWIKEGRQLIPDKLNSNECQALPTIIEFDNRYHMYFCYRQAVGFRNDRNSAYRIGYAYSEDLNNWTRDDEKAGIDVSSNDWDSDMMCYPHVFTCDGRICMLYNGNEFGRFGFGLAVLER
ncbi:MAG: hypothetical protein KBF25_04745 [Chitinophagaceae bacterium]|nr:hypothetical protein [Chitinophagaceae bacterium]